MNGDTLSFGTSIKCVRHIVLADVPLINIMTVGKVILQGSKFMMM